jgi:abortive infection bacteriophage resistance protein
MRYTKGALTFEAQLQLLLDRGMHVEDPHRAMLHLERVGYYRLMGYFYPFRRSGSDDFLPGTSFDRSLSLYEFDSRLRALVLDAIGHIEVAVRTAVTYEMAHSYGAFGHCDAANVACRSDWHKSWLDGLHKETERARETFIEHYREKYDDFPQLPIWMASEVMSLGTVSKLVKAMHAKDQKRIAERFQLHAPVFTSWLHAIAVLRNICAHHGRFWNRVLGVQPVRPRAGEWQYMSERCPGDRAFFMLMVVRRLLGSTAADAEAWRDAATAHLSPLLSDEANHYSMGAHKGWEMHPAWRTR